LSAALTAVLAVGLAVLFAFIYAASQGDRVRIGLERLARQTAWSFGWTLPGTPDLADLEGRLSAKGLKLGAPVLVRVFKREFALEVWLRDEGRYRHFATYPICRWSGRLGPKLREGDRQSPEGFYLVGKRSLNPQSRWHRSFNLGFPNVYDRAHGRTGSFLMVHGGCSSIGCYAITNAAVDEVWRLVTAALNGGQMRFQVQAFPFRMTEANLARYEGDPRLPFWRQLKQGHDLFEAAKLPPRVRVCRGKYAFEPSNSAPEGERPILRSCRTEARSR